MRQFLAKAQLVRPEVVSNVIHASGSCGIPLCKLVWLWPAEGTTRKRPQATSCKCCGYPCSQRVCQCCSLIDALQAKRRDVFWAVCEQTIVLKGLQTAIEAREQNVPSN